MLAIWCREEIQTDTTPLIVYIGGSCSVKFCLEEGLSSKGATLMAQLVKNLPAIQETPVRFLGWEDPLEKG